jgi:hypothetical protein
MRKRTIIATGIAGGVVATALIVTPSFAAISHLADSRSAGSAHSSQPHSPSDEASGGRSPGAQQGKGMKHGAGKGMSHGAGDGMEEHMQSGQGPGKGPGEGYEQGHGIGDVASGTLTAEQKTVLTEMAAEEKVAYDLYIAFAQKYDETVFSRVAQAETKHLAAVRTLLERYGITDPTVGLDAGKFSTDSAQKLYDSLLAQGSASVDAAFEAARTVEKTDIADLTAASVGVTAPDVRAVYTNLLAGSERHLVAFGG